MKIESVQALLTVFESQEQVSQHALRDVEASAEIWLAILDSHPELKRRITLTRTLPEAVLQRLAHDDDPSVRCDVANRRALSVKLFCDLAADQEDGVRARIAWNKKTPVHILRSLATDPSEVVSEPAMKSLRERGVM